MKEGEFKRRLYGEGVGFQITKILRAIETEDIRKIVEEARKEFPLEQFKCEEPRKWNMPQYEVCYAEAAKKILEMASWFIKWFGEGDKQE